MSDVPPGDHARARDDITRYWQMRARSYEDSEMSLLHMGPAKDAWLDAWRRVLPPPPADVLDVGTGTGHAAVLMAGLGHRVIGIDLAESMLDLARAKCAGITNPPTFAQGDAVAPPFPPASFDAVTSRYLLWTLRKPQVAFACWRQLLRPGGVLVAVDGPWFAGGFPRESEGDALPMYAEFLRLYDEQVVASRPFAEMSTLDTIVAMVAESGFSDVRVTQLTEIRRLERRFLSDTSNVRLQFMLTARASANLA